MKISKIDLIPLKIIVLYIILGLSLSFWGPIRYINYNELPVFIYIMYFILLFSIGYLFGLLQTNNALEHKNYHQVINIKKILFWVKISILLISFIQIITLIVSIGNGTLNLSLSKMGEAYVNTYTDYERGTGNLRLSFLIQTLTYIPYLTTLILGAFYFKELSKTYKFLVVFVYISIIILETIGHGKQKQLGDLIIFLMIIIILKSNLIDISTRKKIFKRIFFFSLLGLIALISILSFRYAAIEIDASNINDKVHALIEYDTDNIVFQIFGDKIGFPLSVFTGYLSQGYYGLSLAMQEPFQWTYFMGNSYSLSVLMERFFAVPIDFHDTYPYRVALSTGWDDSKWSTVFVWFAGDFTFIGTLFLFSIIAYLYAQVWREAYYYKNPISIILFSMLSIALLYIPANNQLLHTPGSIIAIFYFIILWIFKHKKFNFTQKVL